MRALALLLLCCVARAELVVVLAHYKEPEACVRETIETVRRFVPDAKAYVFSKGKPPEQRPHWIYRYLVNSGREGDTHLRYIIENYDKLPEHVLFTQACPSGMDLFVSRLELFTPGVQAMSLSGYEQGTCEGTAAYLMYRLHDIYALVNGEFCPPDTFVSFMQGVFIVSRERILRNPRSLYVYLLKELHDAHGVVSHDAPRTWNGPSDVNYFSYELERAWAIIWRCVKMTEDPCY